MRAKPVERKRITKSEDDLRIDAEAIEASVLMEVWEDPAVNAEGVVAPLGECGLQVGSGCAEAATRLGKCFSALFTRGYFNICCHCRISVLSRQSGRKKGAVERLDAELANRGCARALCPCWRRA